MDNFKIEFSAVDLSIQHEKKSDLLFNDLKNQYS